jgi:DNA-binding NtrC family response regulator
MKCLHTFKDFFTHSSGYKLFVERRFVPALEHFEAEMQKAKDRRVREYARFYAAKCCYVMGQYPRVKRYLIQANSWAGKNDERPLRMACVFTLATLEVAMGNHEKGLSVFEKFRSLYGDRLEIYDHCMLLLNLALTHIRMGNVEKAELMMRDSEVICKRANDLHLDTYFHYYMGLLANRRGNFSEAYDHLDRATELSEEGKDLYDQTRCYWQLGNLWLRQERYDQALKTLKKGIRIAKRAGFKVEAAKCLNDFAWAYFKKGKMTEAKSYAEEAILTGREAGVDTSNFLDTLEQINAHINDFYEEEKLIAELERESASEMEIVGYSDQMVKLTEAIKIFAPCVDPVLIIGATGTGKELVARAVFRTSDRSEKVFIKRNCAAIPENLIESELFGHVKGAFTGATSDRKGIFEDADRGTLFLDEIGEMPLSLQSKLLRVLECGEFYRVGSTELIKVDVRIIAATNKNLALEVSKNNFREDLFYRLNTVHLEIPHLKNRKEDVSVLVNHFLYILNDEYDKYYKVISEDALAALENYHYPGNVRELKNIVRAAYLISKGRQITASDMSRFFQPKLKKDTVESAQSIVADAGAQPAVPAKQIAPVDSSAQLVSEQDGNSLVVPFTGNDLVNKVSLKEYVLEAEKKYLISVLRHCDSVNKACSVLKISRPTFYQKLKVHEISLSNKRLV